MRDRLRTLTTRYWRTITGVSIRYKLLGMVLAVILVLGVAVTLQVRNRLARDLAQELETRGIAIARDLSDDAEELILTQNIFGLYQELRKGLENNPDVRYVFVLDSGGHVLAHSFPRAVPLDLIGVNPLPSGQPWRVQNLNSDEGPLTDIAMPILDGKLGVVRLGLSHRRLHEAVTRASRELVLITALVLVAGAVITLLLTRVFTAPILRLVDATRAVGRGDLSVREPVQMEDEIGELTAAFNAMTADLARIRDELVQQNRDLTALNAVAAAISAARSLEEVLTNALAAACRALDVPAGWVVLRQDSDDSDGVFAARWGLSSDFVAHEEADSTPACHCHQVLRGPDEWRRPILRDDCPRLQRAQANGWAEARLVCHLSVPLMSHDRPLGVLNLAASDAAAFQESRVRLAGAIARQMGVAVDAELQRQRVLDEMARREALRGQLLSRVMAAQEEERRRIARELHDEAGQSLTSLLVGLRVLEEQVQARRNGADMQAQVLQLKQLADGVLEELHRLAMDLRPASLDHVGLVGALEQMLRQIETGHAVAAQLETVGLEDVVLAPQVETQVYRIMQEALTNAVRHSGAEHIDVLLECREDTLVVVVEDDGRGFDPGGVVGGAHLGLAGMRERAEQLGGDLVVESEPGGGTTVVLRVPLGQVCRQMSGA
ncbi:MAG: HAMP domain-containing protein [Caldilineae bacterium]|nr:MAG: HAMP domain-containing protein [Caldilineae bacterium]